MDLYLARLSSVPKGLLNPICCPPEKSTGSCCCSVDEESLVEIFEDEDNALDAVVATGEEAEVVEVRLNLQKSRKIILELYFCNFQVLR